MKSTGIVRKVDQLGRIVIPVELRRNLGVDVKDSLEVFVENDSIILKKHEPSCIFCGQAKDVTTYKNKKICPGCLSDLENLKG